MSISYQVFKDVRDVTLGGSPVAGVETVHVIKQRREVRAAGDGDLFEDVAAAGACSVSGAITTTDPAAAASQDGRAGTLSFVWKDGGLGEDRTVTVSDVTILAIDVRAALGRPSSGVISFVAAGSDGMTDPVSIA